MPTKEHGKYHRVIISVNSGERHNLLIFPNTDNPKSLTSTVTASSQCHYISAKSNNVTGNPLSNPNFRHVPTWRLQSSMNVPYSASNNGNVHTTDEWSHRTPQSNARTVWAWHKSIHLPNAILLQPWLSLFKVFVGCHFFNMEMVDRKIKQRHSNWFECSEMSCLLPGPPLTIRQCMIGRTYLK